MALVRADTGALERLGEQFAKARADVERALEEGTARAGELIAKAAQAKADDLGLESVVPTIRAYPVGAAARITAGSAKVPIAKWYEHGRSNSGTWLHPVFPQAGSDRATWHWAKQTNPLRPFLGPALRDSTDDAMELVARSLAASLDVALGA